MILAVILSLFVPSRQPQHSLVSLFSDMYDRELNLGPAIPSRENLFAYMHFDIGVDKETSIEADHVELRSNGENVVEKFETFRFLVKKTDLEKAIKSKSSVTATRSNDYSSKMVIDADMLELLEQVDEESRENEGSQIHYRVDLEKQNLDRYISDAYRRYRKKEKARKSEKVKKGSFSPCGNGGTLFQHGSWAETETRYSAALPQRRRRKLRFRDYIPSLTVSLSEARDDVIKTFLTLAAFSACIRLLNVLAWLFWESFRRTLLLVLNPLRRRSRLIRKITSGYVPVAFSAAVVYRTVQVPIVEVKVLLYDLMTTMFIVLASLEEAKRLGGHGEVSPERPRQRLTST